jgi:putative endonuclease
VNERQRLGRRGEQLAAEFLSRLGFDLIGQNVRVRSGEIDLVARDGRDFVFVEVRTRRGAEGLAAQSLGRAKLRRMWRCATEYCVNSDVDLALARLDVVTVDLVAQRGHRQVVEHFRGVEVPG